MAEKLYGPHGKVILNQWFDIQIARITDLEFASLFSDHIALQGVSQTDYNHRYSHFQDKSLLGGIRFFGQDSGQPFVDVIAHNFDDWETLGRCVASEWKAFAPSRMRLLLTPGIAIPDSAYIDMSIHASRYKDMAPSDSRVSLRPFTSVEEIIKMVTVRYNHIFNTNPALANHISAARPEDLRVWHSNDQIRAIHPSIHRSLKAVGLLAIAPGAIEWIEGDEVNEEVVLPAYNGHSLAASAQCAWAEREDIDPDRLLVGTIDNLNASSKRSAIKAGRNIILKYVFFPLDQL